MKAVRILIVDDEAMIRRGIERLVLSCGDGYEVIGTFADGQSALDFLHGIQGAVDLIITDVRMPEMDGLTFIKEAKKQYSFFPLLISGYDDFEYLQSALREGAVDYILKPVNREQFRTRMMAIRDKIITNRMHWQKWTELERQGEQLKRARQTQMLSDITATGKDPSRFGYWVNEFPNGRYVMLNISLDDLPVKARSFTIEDWKAYTFALENIIGEMVSYHLPQNIRQGWWWRGGDSDFWALLYSPEDGKSGHLTAEVSGFSMQIRSSIQKFTPFSVSIGQSDVIEDLYMLPNARQQALSLINYRLLFGGNQVFRSTIEKHAETRPGSKLDSGVYQPVQHLRRSIEQARMDEAEIEVQRVFGEVGKMESPASIQRAIQYMMIQIHSVWMEHSSGNELAVSLEDALQNVKKAANLSQLREHVTDLLGMAIRHIQQARQKENAKPVEQAKSWIEENLCSEITIKKIADSVYMNPTYFCQYFKMQTGETILDFVTRKRMEKAKELLCNPILKMYEISARVGYQDTKYFSRLFKQWTGQSPSQYRDQQTKE